MASVGGSKIAKGGSVKSLHTGDSSTQDEDIAMGNRRAVAVSCSVSFFKSMEVAKTLEVANDLGLEVERCPDEVGLMVANLVEKESNDWVDARAAM
ncbi:hypothetical protein Tsubulata_001801 [Turnera subulata]|uniref:Uncharacterized protein n=1 Tax=Turnera subulata TaxID=218843 RepID=A0A9Q0J7C2_9ROSI|nr:hypothetical protein Tsubulata_001801 [Turnera subulata]